jgi:hypothetical protein
LPSVSRLSRKCGSLDISQPYGPSRPVTGIVLLFRDNSLRFTSHEESDMVGFSQLNFQLLSILKGGYMLGPYQLHKSILEGSGNGILHCLSSD